jgi:hypothetical protein
MIGMSDAKPHRLGEHALAERQPQFAALRHPDLGQAVMQFQQQVRQAAVGVPLAQANDMIEQQMLGMVLGAADRLNDGGVGEGVVVADRQQGRGAHGFNSGQSDRAIKAEFGSAPKRADDVSRQDEAEDLSASPGVRPHLAGQARGYDLREGWRRQGRGKVRVSDVGTVVQIKPMDCGAVFARQGSKRRQAIGDVAKQGLVIGSCAWHGQTSVSASIARATAAIGARMRPPDP